QVLIATLPGCWRICWIFATGTVLSIMTLAKRPGSVSCPISEATLCAENNLMLILLRPFCRPVVLAHSPLAKGVLTGRYTPGHVFAADDERAQMARFQGNEFSRLLAWTVPLRRWAEERGHTLLELAIAWVLSHPAVTVCLCGAKSPEQIDDHVRAASWHLSTDDRRDIDRILSINGAADLATHTAGLAGGVGAPRLLNRPVRAIRGVRVILSSFVP